MKCNYCHCEKDTERLPRGWKRHDEQVYCAACWGRKYHLRAIVMRVASPLDQTWAEFREAIKHQWIAHTRLANWCTTECYVRDVRRDTDGDQRMPGWKAPYLYPEARVLFPSISPQAVSSALNHYQAKYRASRYGVIWTAEQVLATYRYPQPMVCHNQAWSAELVDDRPCVSVRIGEGRWGCRLVGGHRYRRQLPAFRAIVSGSAIKGELQIYRRRTSGPNGDGKERGVGGQQRGYEILVKMVAWLPKAPDRERSGTLHVRTDSDSLLIALDDKSQRLWTVNADQAKRWVAENQRRLQRLADDQKAEQRPVPTFADRRQDHSRKFRHRLDSLINETAAQVVGFADRRRFAEIRYDDTDQRFVDRFPYHELQTRIAVVCDERNIGFTPTSGGVGSKTETPLAETEDE